MWHSDAHWPCEELPGPEAPGRKPIRAIWGTGGVNFPPLTPTSRSLPLEGKPPGSSTSTGRWGRKVLVGTSHYKEAIVSIPSCPLTLWAQSAPLAPRRGS